MGFLGAGLLRGNPGAGLKGQDALFHRFPVAAVPVQTGEKGAGLLGGLFNQKRRPANRAGFVDRFIPGRVVAIRITVAAVKYLAAFGVFLYKFTLTVFLGALDSG